MPLTAERIAGWTRAVSGNADFAFALEELECHLSRVGGSPDSGSITLAIDSSLPPGDARVEVAAERVAITGATRRAVLDGVYWLLDQLGFAWVEPGDDGAVYVPGRELGEGVHRVTHRFARRTLILGQDALHDDWRAWMEWASRNGLNDVFFHDTPPSRWDRAGAVRPHHWADLAADRGGWLFERWDSDGDAIVAEASRRGMTLQFGGHHLSTLLPRRHLASHPEWFPERNGSRDGRFNLCTSSDGAIETLRENARSFFARFAGANTYHLWPDDIPGGGWCECAVCAGLSASDQALRATNEVAGVLAEMAPGACVAHLAYHDTLAAPSTVTPQDNVRLLWAPRERCYAHAIDEGACARNAAYWGSLAPLQAAFQNDAHRIDVMEYYSDGILFKGLAPVHLRILDADSEAYAGVAGGLGSLVVGDRPWLGPPWHAWAFAHAATGRSTVAAALEQYCSAAFPATAAGMTRYYRALDAALAKVFDVHDFVTSEPRDVLDYASEPLATLVEKAAELEESEQLLRTAWEALPDYEGDDSERGRSIREAAQAEAMAYAAGHLIHRTIAWAGALRGERAAAEEHLLRAEERLSRLQAWDQQWNSPGFAVIAVPMRAAMARYTRDVRRILDGAAP